MGVLSGLLIGSIPVLLLPEEACDGQSHTLMLQVYTSVPLPFGGLTLRPRRMVNWQLYHLMQTLLEVHLALNEGDPARNALLARLDTAYNMLDLREGWQGERFADSAQAAYEYLFKEYPTINRGSTSRGGDLSQTATARRLLPAGMPISMSGGCGLTGELARRSLILSLTCWD